MPMRNGDHGYGAVTKTLHWVTVFALLAQVLVGLTMEADASAERAEAAAEARAEQAKEEADRAKDRSEADEEQAERIEEQAEAEADAAADVQYLFSLNDGVDLLDVHVLLGVTLLLLAVARVIWRGVGGLPPWASVLSSGARTLAHWTERVMLICLFVVPASGLALVVRQDDGLVWLHVGALLALAAAVTVHLAMVLWHTLVKRGGLLGRMLPGRRP